MRIQKIFFFELDYERNLNFVWRVNSLLKYSFILGLVEFQLEIGLLFFYYFQFPFLIVL